MNPPARSLLFVPGDRPDRFGTALRSGADQVILDLEDAVAPAGKPAARTHVRAFLEHGTATVRVSAGDQLPADLAALTGAPGLAGVVAAKAEDPGQLQAIGDRLGVPVLALVETARGVARARELAAVPAVARLALGTADLALDLGAADGWEPMLMARSELVLASRLAGRPGPVDGVTLRLEDEAAVAEAMRRAAAVGFTGKLCVHPRQVPPVHRALRPSAAELAWAEEVLAASAGGPAAARVGGEMVDRPVLLRAERIVAAGRRGGGRDR